jgi:hypothetical protein
METCTESNAVWELIVERLGGEPCGHPLSDSEFSAMDCSSTLAVKVSIIGRLTSGRTIVSWRSATTGHYGAQVWRQTNSRRSGTCVLSGDPIKRGDFVYCPAKSRRPPANADAMILSHHMEAAARLTTADLDCDDDSIVRGDTSKSKKLDSSTTTLRSKTPEGSKRSPSMQRA